MDKQVLKGTAMHIRAAYDQSLWSNPITALGSWSPMSASDALAAGTSQSGLTTVTSGGIFGNLIATLIQQQAPNSSEDLQDFLHSFFSALAPSDSEPTQAPSTPDSSKADGLAGRIQSLINALAGGTSSDEATSLSTTFNQLVSGSNNSGKVSASQGSSLTLGSVLQGMLERVQLRGSSASAVGQIIDTYA